MSELGARNVDKTSPYIDRNSHDPSRYGGSPMEIKLLITFAIIVLVLHSIYRIYSDYSGLSKKVNDLEQRMTTLEKTRRTRIPYEVAEDIINARAALNRQKDDFQVSLSLIENAEAWLDKAMTVGIKQEKGE